MLANSKKKTSLETKVDFVAIAVVAVAVVVVATVVVAVVVAVVVEKAVAGVEKVVVEVGLETKGWD